MVDPVSAGADAATVAYAALRKERSTTYDTVQLNCGQAPLHLEATEKEIQG